MTPEKILPEEIIKENAKRLAVIHAPYDPCKGSVPGKIDMVRCQEDFEYWAATCCFIKNKKGGEDILFRLNRPQRRMVRIFEKMRHEQRPIRLILLKARQWGGSTCAQLYMAWLQMVHKEGLNSLIIAHQHAATAEIRDMFMRMIDSYPASLFEEDKLEEKDKKRNMSKRTEGAGPGAFRVVSRNFKVKVGSAERPNSCLGGDYSLVHCSEVAFWRKTRLKTPEDMMRAACSGVLFRPLTMIVLESTANGTDNFFHDEYEAARQGESQFEPLFVPWFEIDQYSLDFKSPNHREDFAEQLLAGKDNRQADNGRRQSGAYLWWLWQQGATLEAIHWYVKERAKYSDHGLMASVYPSDDVEAFVHSGARVFDPYKVEALKVGCVLAAETGEISSDGISGEGALTGLRFIPDRQGHLRIWKHPARVREVEISRRYVTVVDIGGRSEKSDWSVIAVFDRAGMLEGEGPEIVAQWRGHTDFDLLTWNAARIAKYYCDSLLVVESNTLETRDRDRNVEGDQSGYLLEQLKQVYPNLYSRRRKPEDIRQGLPVKYGFHTNIATKPLIISNLVRIVREGLYVERDEMALKELLTYEQRPDGSYGALSGKHDDLLMTRAIGLHICYNEMEMPCRVLPDDNVDYYSLGRRGGYGVF